jgi:hypothetical protein
MISIAISELGGFRMKENAGIEQGNTNRQWFTSTLTLVILTVISVFVAGVKVGSSSYSECSTPSPIQGVRWYPFVKEGPESTGGYLVNEYRDTDVWLSVSLFSENIYQIGVFSPVGIQGEEVVFPCWITPIRIDAVEFYIFISDSNNVWIGEKRR